MERQEHEKSVFFSSHPLYYQRFIVSLIQPSKGENSTDDSLSVLDISDVKRNQVNIFKDK